MDPREGNWLEGEWELVWHWVQSWLKMGGNGNYFPS